MFTYIKRGCHLNCVIKKTNKVVYQIRNSVKYVGSKHQKEFMKDLIYVYGAVSKEAVETELLNLDEK